jgi:hypothetical protein
MVKTFDLTKPVRTRDGRSARIICTDRKYPASPIVALVADGLDGHEYIQTYTPEGRAFGLEPSDFDLVNIPEKVTCHVYRNKVSGNMWLSTTYYYPEALCGSEWVKQVEIEV